MGGSWIDASLGGCMGRWGSWTDLGLAAMAERDSSERLNWLTFSLESIRVKRVG